MKIKSLLTAICIFLTTTICFSQSFYEFEWVNKKISYKAFLIYNTDDHMTVRVGYTNNKGAYKVAEYNCVRKEYTNRYGKKIVKYNGSNAKVVYSSKKDNYGYVADNFYFIDVDKNYKYKKLYVDDDKKKSILNTKVKYRKLKPEKDFTPTYLNRFYSKSNATYKKLMNKKKQD